MTKIPTCGNFKVLSGIYCDMRILDVKIGALLCFLNGSGIYLLETSNSVINCKFTVPDCGLPNGTKLSNILNFSKCSAHFSKVKMLYFKLKFCVFQYTNSTCIHNNIFRDCIMASSCYVCYNKDERNSLK